jgi:hypothetical protein
VNAADRIIRWSTGLAVLGVAVDAVVVSCEHASSLVRAEGESGWAAASIRAITSPCLRHRGSPSPRNADQARDADWTHEDYIAAVPGREVSARNASGAELRIRAAGFPACKTLEDFDSDAQPAARNQVGALTSGRSWPARNVVLLSPPGTGKTHLAIALGVTQHGTATACCSPP